MHIWIMVGGSQSHFVISLILLILADLQIPDCLSIWVYFCLWWKMKYLNWVHEDKEMSIAWGSSIN